MPELVIPFLLLPRVTGWMGGVETFGQGMKTPAREAYLV